MPSLNKPRGTVVRSIPDWWADYLMGSMSNTGPCVGNRSFCGLYNNATDGSVIRVYGLNLQVGASTNVTFRTFKGIAGVADTGEGVGAPINPFTPIQWGQNYFGAQSSGVGTPFGGVSVLAGQVQDLAPGYPLAIVPPGYELVVMTDQTNVFINVGFRWICL